MSHFTTQMEVYLCGLVGRCADSVVLIFRFIVWEALVNSLLQLDTDKEMQLAMNPKTGQVGGQILLHIPELLFAILRGLVVMQQRVADQKNIDTRAHCFSFSLALVYFLNSF